MTSGFTHNIFECSIQLWTLFSYGQAPDLQPRTETDVDQGMTHHHKFIFLYTSHTSVMYCILYCHFSYGNNYIISLWIHIRYSPCAYMYPFQFKIPSHIDHRCIQNTKDTPTMHYVVTITSSRELRFELLLFISALLAIRWPHAGRHLALVTFVHPT